MPDIGSFAAYSGVSMYPTLVDRDMMELTPYRDAREIRVGDVVLFPVSETRAIVHRVIRITRAGVVTRGDNCPVIDFWMTQPARIIGCVVAAQRRGGRRRTIRGGWVGMAWHLALRVRRAVDQATSHALRPMYYALADNHVFSRLVPGRFAPRVVAFQREGARVLRLLYGSRCVGTYDPARDAWSIQRPFRLFVDEHTLLDKYSQSSH
jgi:hypothetical protein